MKQFRTMTYPYIFWAAIMIVVPMLMIILYAFTDKGTDVTTIRFTFDNFLRFFQDEVFVAVLWRSIYIAIITTLICILIGYPVAYAIFKKEEKNAIFWILLITLPTWINMLVRTYAWVGIFQDNGFVNAFLELLGFESIQILYTTFAVVLGMVYNFVPFMILQIHTALSKMDKSLLDAANDLGANGRETFLRIILPLSMPGVVSGITLVFLPAVSSFFIPKLLGGGQFVMIGNIIESEFLVSGNWNFGSAISLVMAIIIMISMYITKKIDRSVEGGSN